MVGPSTHAAAQACAHTAPSCNTLGLARGATTVVPSCRGVSVAGCLACDESDDVLCAQIALASARRPTHGFAIADGRHEAAIVWASGETFSVALIDPLLNVAMVSPTLPLAPTGAYAIAATRGGWLLAFVSHGRLLTAPLERAGTLRGPPVDAGDAPDTALLDLVPFDDHALLVVRVPDGGTGLHWLSRDGAVESPAAIHVDPAGVLHGVSVMGSRALIVAHREDGARPRPGDILVAWVGQGATARGTWQSDQAFGGIGTIEGTTEMDVSLPDDAHAVLRVRMHASPTGTLDEVTPARGRPRRFSRRLPPTGTFPGLSTPTGATPPTLSDRRTALLRSLGGTLSIGFVPSFVPDAGLDADAEDHGAQIPLALSGPGRGARGVRARRAGSRRAGSH